VAGVSLGLRSVLLSTRSPDERLQNPTIDCSAEETKLAPGDSVAFTCDLTGSFTGFSAVWGYTTAGGWDGASQLIRDPDEDQITYTYFAPEEEADVVDIWLMAIDGEGGVGLWSSTITVQ
ncbi:MAG: hypothetical protein AAFV53_25395, partial [Myxococcota bacterium]